MDSNCYSHFSSEDEISPTCTATTPASHIFFWNEELQDWLNGFDNCYFWKKMTWQLFTLRGNRDWISDCLRRLSEEFMYYV